MALLSSFRISVLFYAIVFICSVSSSKYVPVLIWDSVKNDNSMPALNHMHAEEFKDVLTDRVQNKNAILVVFTEESLSPEDLMSHDFEKKSIYSSISELRKKHHMTYYPYVESPVEVLRKISKNVNEISYKQVKKLKLTAGQTVIIDLNDAKDNEDRETLLMRHDNMIYTTFKKLISENKDVIAIYTGKRSSWESATEQSSEIIRQRRETKPTEVQDTKYLFTCNNIVAAYASNNSMFIQAEKGNNATKINLVNCKEPSKTCENNDNSDISFCLKDSTEKITFTFDHTVYGYWYVREISIPVLNKTDEVAMINTTMEKINVPLRFSFHCGRLDFHLKHVYNDSNNKLIEVESTLSLPDFQAEYFNVTRNGTMQFSSAYDCVGFTTGPIWSGIFVTFILALIMTFGLCMIMDIKTMDRFDDPKGKTISINVSE